MGDGQFAWCAREPKGDPSAPADRRTSGALPGRAAAIYALGLLNDRRAVQLLGRVLSDRGEPEGIRDLAADALGGVPAGKRAIKALLANHNDGSDKIRFTVVNALGNFLPVPAVENALRAHLHDSGRYPGRPTIGELARSFLDEGSRRHPQK